MKTALFLLITTATLTAGEFFIPDTATTFYAIDSLYNRSDSISQCVKSFEKKIITRKDVLVGNLDLKLEYFDYLIANKLIDTTKAISYYNLLVANYESKHEYLYKMLTALGDEDRAKCFLLMKACVYDKGKCLQKIERLTIDEPSQFRVESKKYKIEE